MLIGTVTRLTDNSRYRRAGQVILTLHFLPHLRGFFPLVREACARLSSNSRSRLAFFSSAAALAFFLACYRSKISPFTFHSSCNDSKAHLGALLAFDTAISIHVDPALAFGHPALYLVRTTTPVCDIAGAHLDIRLYLCTGTVVRCSRTWRLMHRVSRAVEADYIYTGTSDRVDSGV